MSSKAIPDNATLLDASSISVFWALTGRTFRIVCFFGCIFAALLCFAACPGLIRLLRIIYGLNIRRIGITVALLGMALLKSARDPLHQTVEASSCRWYQSKKRCCRPSFWAPSGLLNQIHRWKKKGPESGPETVLQVVTVLAAVPGDSCVCDSSGAVWQWQRQQQDWIGNVGGRAERCPDLPLHCFVHLPPPYTRGRGGICALKPLIFTFGIQELQDIAVAKILLKLIVAELLPR